MVATVSSGLLFFVKTVLMLVGARITVEPLVIVLSTREAITLLLFLVGPFHHHVAEGHNRSRSISSEIAIKLLGGKAVVKAVNDVVGGDIGDGGSHIEEPFDVGPQSLPTLLFAQA